MGRGDDSRIRAVLIGINEYESPDIPSLAGCVNDALLVRWLLKTTCGVANEDIHVLVNRRATKRNILDRLNSVLRRARAGDVVVFYFSGHGSQVRDRDGDEMNDALDELICPYDMDWDRPTYIIDDELEAAIEAVSPDILLEAFFDCCFWGAGPWDELTPPPLGAAGTAVRYLPPPIDVFARAEGEEDRLRLQRFAGPRAAAANNVVWAASQEGQPAAEDDFDGRTHGVFTYYGCQFISEGVGHPVGFSREALLDELRLCMEEHRYDQWPGLVAPPPLRGLEPFVLRQRVAAP